jgi:hypothetical protein
MPPKQVDASVGGQRELVRAAFQGTLDDDFQKLVNATAAAVAAGIEPLFSVPQTAIIESSGESTVWEWLKNGDYDEVYKDGARTKN